MFVGRENMSVAGKNVLQEKWQRKKICISGGLAIGVPGELRAYQRAHTEFGGGVTWKQLFEPTIQLCREGFVISASQAAAITQSRRVILADPTLRFLMNRILLYAIDVLFLANFLLKIRIQVNYIM